MKSNYTLSAIVIFVSSLYFQSCSSPEITSKKCESTNFKSTVSVWRNYMFNVKKPLNDPEMQQFDSALTCFVDYLNIKKSNEMIECIDNFGKLAELDSNGISFLKGETAFFDSAKASINLNTPFRTKLFTTSNIPYIEVLIGGKKRRLIIDTGCQASLISGNTKILSAANSKKEKNIILEDGRDNTVDNVNQLIDISFSNDTINLSHEFYVLPEKNFSFTFYWFWGTNVDGFLGWDFLRNYRFTIDYANQEFVLENSPSSNERNYDVFYLKNPVLFDSKDTNDLKYYFLDTGATFTELNSDDSTAIYDDTHDFKTIAGKTVTQPIKHYDTYELKLGKYDFNIKDAIVKFKPKLYGISGTIGSDMFQNGKIVIDNKNGIFEYSE